MDEVKYNRMLKKLEEKVFRIICLEEYTNLIKKLIIYLLNKDLNWQKGTFVLLFKKIQIQHLSNKKQYYFK